MSQSDDNQTTPDYKVAGWIGEILGMLGKWRRMLDEIRYQYGIGKNTRCPVCLERAAGVSWAGWFACDRKGCCVALVDTGEVFLPVSAADHA